MASIVVAVDGSENADRALEYAIDYAKRYGAALHAIYVEPEMAPPRALEQYARAEHIPDTPSAIYHAIGESLLDRLVDRAEDAGVDKVERHTAHGDAAKGIVDLADRLDADAVILGSRGFSEMRGLLLGSVSMKVQAHAPCTVITVR
ncbi:MAG: universal stress protein [Azospirillaceae bacterium]